MPVLLTMAPNRIVELSETIQNHTKIVDDYLEANNLPTPSFDISTPLRLPLPPDIQVSQAAVLDAADELTALMLGPAGSLVGRVQVCLSSKYTIPE